MPVVGVMPYPSSVPASSSGVRRLPVLSQRGLPWWRATFGGGSDKSSSNKLAFGRPLLRLVAVATAMRMRDVRELGSRLLAGGPGVLPRRRRRAAAGLRSEMFGVEPRPTSHRDRCFAVRGEPFSRSIKQGSCEGASPTYGKVVLRLLLRRTLRRRQIWLAIDGVVHWDLQGRDCFFLLPKVLCVIFLDTCPSSSFYWVPTCVCCTLLVIM